ncbi:hypothetical protein BK796_03565 [Kosakonia pseudosacchari]|uniref:Uncharacterized protein n=1 Tax=Kosakonia pseudosacchari TaxID=1646340 RepID=A0ABX4IT16_9ENTR|nr:hypothetical protein BK796_03565 [Kosakonia pseudosacchari]
MPANFSESEIMLPFNLECYIAFGNEIPLLTWKIIKMKNATAPGFRQKKDETNTPVAATKSIKIAI